MPDLFVPDPEGHVRYGDGCICGPVYTYNGIPEPGQFSPDCPLHGDETDSACETPDSSVVYEHDCMKTEDQDGKR